MKRIKVAIAVIFVMGIISALAGQSFAYPPFLIKARKFGAKDCTFCHVGPDGGPPFNKRGQWLIEEKERRKSDVINVEWLAEYKADSEQAALGEAKAAAPASPAEREVNESMAQLIEAVKTRNAEALSRLIADDFQETNPEGVIVSKPQVLAALRDFVLTSYSFEDMKTRVFGDTAVMTMLEASKGTFQGQAFDEALRQTLVWVKRDGGWQLVAAHASRPAKR